MLSFVLNFISLICFTHLNIKVKHTYWELRVWTALQTLNLFKLNEFLGRRVLLFHFI